jgi:uncharacterized membrane protein
MSEKDKLISRRSLMGIGVIFLLIGVFLFLAFPFYGVIMISIGIGSLIYGLRSEKTVSEALRDEDFVEWLKTKVKKNKGVAIWYAIEENVALSRVKAKFLLYGNTGMADGFLLAKIAAVMTPKWDVATFIFDFKDWVKASNIVDVIKSVEKWLREKKFKWIYAIVNGRGFERLAKQATLDFRTREIGLVLTDPRRKIIVQGDTWLSKQLLKMLRLKDFKTIKTPKREI